MKFPCPACGRPYKGGTGKGAFVLSATKLEPDVVCNECAARAVLVVAVESGQSMRATLAPFVAHLRRLAKAYELNADERAVGLAQAADVLEAGRVPPIEMAEAPKLVPLARENPRIMMTKPKAKTEAPSAPTSTDAPLTTCAKEILRALIQRGAPSTRTQISILTRYRQSGTFRSTLADLQRRGYVLAELGHFVVTEAGRQARGEVDPLPEGDELLHHWCETLDPCASTILQVFCMAYPAPVSQRELLQATGYKASGSFRAALSQLRTLELVEGYRASHALMESVAKIKEPAAHA